MRLTSTLFFTILIISLTKGQVDLPILKTNSKVVSIKDGNRLRKDYWSISPEEELDIYVSDKTSKTKTVVFYSEIDTIKFSLKAKEHYDFVILLNGKDSCFTRLKSGIPVLTKEDLAQPSDTIPFKLTSSNNLAIQTILNGKDTLDLMFHSASTAVFITEEGMKKVTSIEVDDTTKVNSWGGSASARYSSNNHIQIGQQTWENVGITEDKHSGRGTDGKFGINLFQKKIIEIDYDKNILILHASLPEHAVDYEQFDIIFNRSWMFLESISKTDSNEYKNKYLIHSGYGGTILYDDDFVKKNNIGNQLEVISESELKDSYGNILKTKKAILPSMVFGNIVFEELPVGFFEGKIARQHMSVLGAGLLKRFNLMIDLQSGYIYLKSNNITNLSFPND